MASAAPLIKSSLTSHPNLFQLFQPIGGVSARPLSEAFAGSALRTPIHTTKQYQQLCFANKRMAATSLSSSQHLERIATPRRGHSIEHPQQVLLISALGAARPEYATR